MITNIEAIKNNIVELQAEYQSVLKAGTELQKTVELYDKIESLKLDLANAVLGSNPTEPTYTVVALGNSWGNEIGFFISDVEDPEQYDDFSVEGYENDEDKTFYVARHWHNVNTAEYARVSGSNTLRYAKLVARFEPGDGLYEDEPCDDIITEEDIEF